MSRLRARSRSATAALYERAAAALEAGDSTTAERFNREVISKTPSDQGQVGALYC
jgi:hypothetical protein